MATQNNLTVYSGDGATTFNWQILQNLSPMSLVGVTVLIALKGGSDIPDPTSGANLFTTSNGLTIVNANLGQGTWTVPESYANEPSLYWWHGTVVSAGSVVTWGYGTLTVAAV